MIHAHIFVQEIQTKAQVPRVISLLDLAPAMMLAFAAPQAAGLSLQTAQGVEHRVTENQGAELGYLSPLDRGLCFAFALGLGWVAEESLLHRVGGIGS